MRSVSKMKARVEMYEAMMAGNHVSVDWALKNILDMGKNEFRRYKINKIFNEQEV